MQGLAIPLDLDERTGGEAAGQPEGAGSGQSPAVEFRDVWGQDDSWAQGAAVAFWQRNRIVPPNVGLEQRAQQLVTVLRMGDEMVGLSTAVLRTLPAVRARMAFYRIAVAPDWRGRGFAERIRQRVRSVLEPWSAAHPEERVAGLATVLVSPDYAEKQKRPVWEPGLTLIGYTPQGRQIRVAWFDHARVE